MAENTTPAREPSSIYGFCPWCSHEIQPGEPAVALWLQVEQQAPEPTAIPEIDVLDADGVIALCRDCGNALNGAVLRRLIHQHYRPGSESWS